MRNHFIHLRTQSSYSFLESALTIERITELTLKHKMPAVCLSDNNLFGLLEFALTASQKGVQPIHGVTLNIEVNKDDFAEILLIAKDKIGYQNMLKLVSLSFKKNHRATNYITLQELVEHNHGLIALSCYTDGIVGKNLLANNHELAMSSTLQLQEIFGDRFYFEIMRHNLPEEQLIEELYLKIASDLDIPLVATNKVLFSDVNMHDAHDVLLCIAAGVVKGHEERKKASINCYFKSTQEMVELFKDLPPAIENTICLAQRCCVMAHANPPMLPNFTAQNISETDLIRQDAEASLTQRLLAKFKHSDLSHDQQEKIKERYFERLNYELDIICKMDFAGYFLIVSDFIKWSKQQGILVGPGRGSGAGSIVAWCLLITDLDPIQFGLLFERFLNPERISMPDFDIDFCQERREEVINYVRAKYGDEKVGQIITFGKMQAKAVIKDVARVLELPYVYANYLTDLVPFSAVNPITLTKAIKEVEELSNAAQGKGVYNLEGKEELMKQVLDTSLILEGLHRHSSTHAAGIVISGKDLVELVPVCMDTNSDMLIVQYSMKYCEIAGLVKFDFLGLQTLTVITKCIQLLKEQGTDIDFTDMGFDDEKTYQMLCAGKGVGVFQFESIGMKDTLKRLKPDSIQDLIALGALYRPGPMENIPTYIACKHSLQKPDYLHESLKPILKETYGVVIYQEQVQEIAKVFAGYTLGGADLLRKAMGKKVKKEMDQQEEIFIKGAMQNNVPASQAKSIFATLAKFAGYGFNKAHASAYAVISYQTAYLKANFTVEFLVACLNLEINNQDKIAIFVQEAKDNDITITPPSINISKGYFIINFATPVKEIIYALGAIKGATVNFSKLLVEERENNGDFSSIIDLIERMPPRSINSKLLENLIKSGCFDQLHDNRDQLLLSIPKLLAYSTSYHQEKASSQFSLIKIKSSDVPLLASAETPEKKKMAFYELDVLGLFIKHHPLSEYDHIFKKLNIITSNNLQNLPNGLSQIKLAGVIQKKDSRMSARGRFIILQLSDSSGIFELSIFNEEILRDHVHLLYVKNSVVINCDLLKDDSNIKLTAKHFSAIEEAMSNHQFTLELFPKSHADLEQIVELLVQRTNTQHCNTKIVLYLKTTLNFVAQIELPQSFALGSEDLEFLQQWVRRDKMATTT